MDKLIQQQNAILEEIKRIEINFRKDSPSRKTREYLDERLANLDRLWAEFNANNDKLSLCGQPDAPYFVENQYEEAREFYNNVRYRISSYPPTTKTDQSGVSLSVRKHTTTQSPSREHAPPARAPPAQAPPAPSQQAHTDVEKLLSRQRTNFRAFARLINNINVDNICDKWELEDELRSVQSRWTNIDSLHLEIDNILQGDNADYDNEFSYYENYYKDIKRSLNKKLASAAHIQQTTPQIDIPVFTGKYTQWPTFYDLFSESIHNNNLLTKGQKMQHLKGKLRGEAERLIQHLHISAENYDTAWELLTHRYNNRQLLFTKQIEIFLNQPVSYKQSAYEIRRLYDTSMESINAIQNLGINTSSWDPLIVHLIAKKLDPDTYSDYQENRKNPREIPTLDELMNFLENKFTALEPIQKRKAQTFTPKPSSSHLINTQYNTKYSKGKYIAKPHYQATVTRTWNCPLCQQKHILFQCKKFAKLPAEEKMRTVLKLNVCQNCLYIHDANGCTSAKRCKRCHGDHNTILHDGYYAVFKVHESLPHTTYSTSSITQSQPVVTTAPSSSYMTISNLANNNFTPANKNHNVNYVAANNEEILLTTLLLKIQAYDGTYTVLRALLDQGSQISLISERAAQLLGLPRQHHPASISGIGYGSKQGKGVVTLNCMSIYDDYTFSTQAIVINKVINNLPNGTFNKQPWSHLQNIKLADPDFNVSRPIDILLDASVYSDILMDGLIRGSNKAPMAQQTRVGWLLSGHVRTFNCCVVLNNLADISQYWELEEVQSSSTTRSEEEEYCEQLYQSTTRRLENGKYEVAIPMKQDFEKYLGTSRQKAMAQLYNLERKMTKNTEFSESYIQFMREYLSLGHMTPVTKKIEPSYYLPHHGVLKADSTTTKLRTVFNASAKTSTGYSLNDLMLQGPNLQSDLHSLILSWRKHKIVKPSRWHHVSTNLNAADCATRRISTPGFLAAFRRFCARRATPSHMYSDNGTNFKGADRLLTKEYKEILATIDRNFFANINSLYIKWNFNAPSFPSAGGLWEAAVKSLKYHLRRVMGEQRLNYEEFNTLIQQIEACLNSRPLVALTESPDDDYLTPGHFLVGGPLLSRPQAEPEHFNLNTRWHMVQTMNRNFWKRWSSEYLQQLQMRSKWQSPSRNFEVDNIVLVKEDILPPGKRALSRIVQVHPGKDGYVRVVSIKTMNGIIKRPILKLSRLPVKESDTVQVNSGSSDYDRHAVTSGTTSRVQPESQTNQLPQSRRRPRRNKLCNFIFTLILMILFTITPTQGTYNMSNFNSNQSLYFDKQFDINLIRDEWKLVVYYNMSTYWTSLSYLQKYVKRIQKDTSQLSPQYISIADQLQHELSELQHYNVLLQYNTNKRPKRGIINGVGYVANALFGVLDDRFLNQYEKDIEKISYDSNHLRNLLKNQTSIIEAQSNILRRNEDIMYKQFSMVQSHLQNFTNILNQVQSDNEHQFNTISSILSAQILISNLRRIQDNLVNTVTDLSQGHLDAHLIPSEQLQEQMHIISSQLRGDLTLPITEENSQELYKVMKVNSKVGKSFLVIEIKIPLIAKESFELDKIYSIPLNSNIIIETFTPYIAFNLRKEIFILLTEEDTHFCMHLSSGKVLCAFDKPIYEQQINLSFCSLHTNNKTLCTTKTIKCEERWIKLRANNRWLFSCCENCQVRLYCSDTIEMISLDGNGLMDLAPGCVLRSKSVTIYGHTNYLTKLSTKPNIATVSEFSILNHILNSTLPESFIPDNHSHTWEQMKIQLENIKKDADVVYSPVSVHDVHHYTVIYVTLTLLLLVGCIYVVRRVRKTSQQQSRVSPAVTAPVTLHAVEATNVELSQLTTKLQPSSSSPSGVVPSSGGKCKKSVRLSVPKISESAISDY